MRLLVASVLLLASCSGTDKGRRVHDREHENIKRDFVVTDASSDYRPGWIEDATVWARDNGQDVRRYRYFSFETSPKGARNVACNLARADVRASIAGEIATSINRKFNSFMEGRSSVDENNPDVRAMKEFVETSLTEVTTANVHGAEVLKTYWEKRDYQKDLGAQDDFSAWVCAVFVRMDADRLEALIRSANESVANQARDGRLKSETTQALGEQ